MELLLCSFDGTYVLRRWIPPVISLVELLAPLDLDPFVVPLGVTADDDEFAMLQHNEFTENIGTSARTAQYTESMDPVKAVGREGLRLALQQFLHGAKSMSAWRCTRGAPGSDAVVAGGGGVFPFTPFSSVSPAAKFVASSDGVLPSQLYPERTKAGGGSIVDAYSPQEPAAAFEFVSVQPKKPRTGHSERTIVAYSPMSNTAAVYDTSDICHVAAHFPEIQIQIALSGSFPPHVREEFRRAFHQKVFASSEVLNKKVEGLRAFLVDDAASPTASHLLKTVLLSNYTAVPDESEVYNANTLIREVSEMMHTPCTMATIRPVLREMGVKIGPPGRDGTCACIGLISKAKEKMRATVPVTDAQLDAVFRQREADMADATTLAPDAKPPPPIVRDPVLAALMRENTVEPWECANDGCDRRAR